MSSALIPVTPPFSFDECRWWLDRNYDDCLHAATTSGIVKALPYAGRQVLFHLSSPSTDQPPAIQLKILAGPSDPDAVNYCVSFLKEWWDLESDLTPFYTQLKAHPQLSYLGEKFTGLRLIGIPNLFESLCWSIIGQQINLKFAYQMKRRLVEATGEFVEFNSNRYWIFPTPESVLQLDPQQLRDMQFSRQKIAYIHAVAEAFVNNRISKEQLLQLPDDTSRLEALLALKGIGIWTANYVLMKTFHTRSAITWGDAGLLNALISHQLIADKRSTAAIESLFGKFRGWESYLTLYLWRSLSQPTG
ncbi:DNA-3-methyladenine glycosylase family protein [Flavihumibacter petaseus]|uniref:DNA-3-methyladenine glycosylase II n=1 Tax=Flavihumibacter petaseus NBRC 106054 TaxID=1220578 RepID=A0A0E9N5R1_9BACT|nr:DNA glycosylase [Flavihumibacter petaseus]GAO45143.1 3-methyladenine-DNA glycosylase II [Flavihumibacter petaseus NBRC 106054]